MPFSLRISRKHLLQYLTVGLPVFILILAAAYFGALQLARQQLTTALGRTGTIGDIRATLTGIEIENLQIKASQHGWPAASELSAARVIITPDLRSLLGEEILISRIRIEEAVLTILRMRRGVKVLPALLEAEAESSPRETPSSPEEAAHSAIPLRIGRIELTNSRIDFHDATVSTKPHHIVLDGLALRMDDLSLPAMTARNTLTMHARVANQGTLDLEGWLVPASLTSDLQLTLAEVPLKTVEPYLFRQQIGEIKAGRLALDAHIQVKDRRLKAPGHMRLSALELGGLAGIGRDAAAAFARIRGLDADTKRPVDMNFTVQGNLDDGSFSLNDAIYRQAGAVMLKLIGIDIPGNAPGRSLTDKIKGFFSN